MNKFSRLGIVILIILSTVVCDQVSKEIARAKLPSGASVVLLGGLLQLFHTKNPGAFLSLGSELPGTVRFIVVGVFVVGVITAAIILSLKEKVFNSLELNSLAMVAGGGLGNLIDRIYYNNEVFDFALLKLGPLQTGVFNIADLFIVAGVVLLVFVTLRSARRAKEPAA